MEKNGTYSYGPVSSAGRECYRYMIADNQGRIYVDALAATEEQARLMIRLFLNGI